jgi:soluble lytic murein transglycosylase-like protein
MRTEIAAAVLLLSAASGSACAQDLLGTRDRIDAAVAEAVQRFGLPEGWIGAVMRRESGGDPRATSVKGAMGLMQLMPDTWSSLRAELGLGADPYDVHDNVLAGAAYLRQLYDQFGADGVLAAYNAGPGRYLDFVTRGRPLPGETRAYVAAVTRTIAGAGVAGPSVTVVSATAAPVTPPTVFVSLGAAFPPPAAASRGLFVAVAAR